jgi:signal transduction histidine kinase
MTATTRPDAVNILVVDDQPAKLLTYETILGELGDNLITAGSATEALECLLKHEIAVVLVDVCMPELDGYELAAMIRQHPRYQRTALIFVSAVLMTDLDRLRGYECGAVDYVPVPVVPEILRAKVSVFAELYRKTRALERLNTELEQRVAERTAALESTAAALREADRRKDEFLAVLAHELRNPLAPIRTAVQLLRLKELPPAQRDRARDVIERQVEHLVRLIDDLLDVSRITRGTIALHREPVSVGAIVARAVEATRPAIDLRRHTLTVSVPNELLIVEGDQTRLVQLLANILHNASKFTDAGGRISLRAVRSGQDVVISIKDSGVGIPPEAISRVFDLFAQVHTQPDPTQEGLGIGLALVRRLAEMHGGKVSASSDGPGMGTEITVRLPLADAAWPFLTGRATATPQIPPCDPRRILLVDDNRDAADALALQLQLAGHEVRVAYDGIEALATGSEFEPDVVMLDLRMPRMDGYEAARQMRRLAWGQRATLVALTGWGQPQDRQRTKDAGFDLHLAKPVTDFELFRALAVSQSQ